MIKKAIKVTGIRHAAWISAIEVLCGRRPFLEAILRELHQHDEGKGAELRCETLDKFRKQLKFFRKPSQTGESAQDRIVIVVERAELLKEHRDLLHFFVNCQDLAQQNICIILCSRLPLTSYSSIPELKLVPTIHFPQYNKSELIKIIVHNPPPGEHPNVYEFYVNAVLTYHQAICRDLLELWRLVNFHYPLFVKNRRTEDDLNTMWRKLLPTLRRDFTSVNVNVIPGSLNPDLTMHVVKSSDSVINMPRNTKYILIAAYLASRNPTKTDRQYFVKGRGPRKRGRMKNKATILKEIESSSRGPAVFPHSRFQSIYAKLSGNKCQMETSAFISIATLCQSKLLVRYDDSLDDCKYRCMAHLDIIKQICASINFPLEEYLCTTF
jgi:origin recognition complex subunit 5